jgi:hypothetical protein
VAQPCNVRNGLERVVAQRRRRSAGFQACSLRPAHSQRKKGAAKTGTTSNRFSLAIFVGNPLQCGRRLPRVRPPHSRLRTPRPPSAVAKVAPAGDRGANARSALERGRGAGLETRATVPCATGPVFPCPALWACTLLWLRYCACKLLWRCYCGLCGVTGPRAFSLGRMAGPPAGMDACGAGWGCACAYSRPSTWAML